MQIESRPQNPRISIKYICQNLRDMEFKSNLEESNLKSANIHPYYATRFLFTLGQEK